jgi:hypothetical protein
MQTLDSPCRFRSTILWIVLIFGIVFVTMVMCSKVFAHDREHPERDGWMMALQNSAGVLCCSITDTNVVKDVQWDTWRDPKGISHYKIFVEEGWLQVPDDKVVHEPNKYGVPLAWLYHSDGIPEVRCFLPGSGQ